MKTCTKCAETKPISEFSKQAKGLFGVTSQCKACEKARKAEYYLANKADIDERNAAYQAANPGAAKERASRHYQANKSGQAARVRAWRSANLDRARELGRKSAARKRATVKGALEDRVRRRMNETLVSGAKRGRSTFVLLGYSVDDLRTHLERKFLPGMTWENRNLWHIDHVMPLASFTYQTPDDDDFKVAWSLDNLQPLWANDNQVKSDKLPVAA